jgi:hypothetical protein
MELITHLHLVPRFIISRIILLLPSYALLHGMDSDNFASLFFTSDVDSLGHTLLTKEPVEIWMHPPKFLHDMILRHWKNILILKNLLHSFKSEKVGLASSKSSWLDA